MANQRMLDALYKNAYPDELRHHGVEGMSWGERNGPPYPLQGANKKAAKEAYRQKKKEEREERRKERDERAKAKAEHKVQRLKVKEAKRSDKINRRMMKELEERQELEKKKKNILDRANVKEIKRNAKLFTQQEIETAIRKRQVIDQAKYSKWKKKVLENADLDKIKKHPELFTTEDMQKALMRREVLDKQHTRSKADIKKEQEMQERMQKLEKAAKIASSVGTIIGLGKTALGVVNEYRNMKASEANADYNNWKREYDMVKDINKYTALDMFNKQFGTKYEYEEKEKSAQEKVHDALWNDLWDARVSKDSDAWDAAVEAITKYKTMASSGGSNQKKKK